MPADDRVLQLCKAMVCVRKPEHFYNLLQDLCTPAELSAMADRWVVAQLLEKEIPYRKISEMTQVSTATITRVARSMTYGAGGYKELLRKCKTKGSPE